MPISNITDIKKTIDISKTNQYKIIAFFESRGGEGEAALNDVGRLGRSKFPDLFQNAFVMCSIRAFALIVTSVG